MRHICIAMIVTATLACLAPAGDEARPATMPTQPTASSGATATAAANKLPAGAMDKIDQLLSQQPTSTADAVKIMEGVIKAGAEVEGKYPDAVDLYQARLRMIDAAAFLYGQKRDGSSRGQLEGIADRVLKSSAPAREKAQADFYLTFARLTPTTAQATGPSNEEATREIRDLVARYQKTDAAGRAVLMGLVLALRTAQKDLQAELVKELEAKYVDEEGVRGMLRKMGRHPDLGKPFEAELTLVGGGKLSLPKDLAGKVVVVDFWATWCPPCRATIPLLVKMYEKYKDKGVQIVGISLDRPGQTEALAAFIKENKMTWLQTYSGKADDPTARRYGVDSIPAVWVVGKDGKIIFDGSEQTPPEETFAGVAKVIDKALKE